MYQGLLASDLAIAQGDAGAVKAQSDAIEKAIRADVDIQVVNGFAYRTLGSGDIQVADRKVMENTVFNVIKAYVTTGNKDSLGLYGLQTLVTLILDPTKVGSIPQARQEQLPYSQCCNRHE